VCCSLYKPCYYTTAALHLTSNRGKLRLNETAENGTLRKWRSFRQALKSIWSLDSIERLKRRLAAFGNELEIHLIMALRYVLH
jgi:hypothetical protein